MNNLSYKEHNYAYCNLWLNWACAFADVYVYVSDSKAGMLLVLNLSATQCKNEICGYEGTESKNWCKCKTNEMESYKVVLWCKQLFLKL